jgi:ATP-binding cassette, subfamily B, bacterial
MQLLWSYIKQYKKTLALALFLAAINQIFSLLDPQIFRLIVDRYATRVHELSAHEFVHGVLLLLLGAITVAFISRVAKNFQDYYVNVIMQRVGTKLYAHGVKHSLSLPFAMFEDQRSGELLSKLQKARTDSQALITSAVNILFFSMIGVIFVLIYALSVHWSIALAFFLIIPLLGFTAYFTSRKIKAAQKEIVKQTSELAGSTTETLRNVELVKSLGLEKQETERLNNVNEQILALELHKVKLIRKLSFIQGTTINAVRSGIQLLMLWLIFHGDVTLGQFFSLLFYSFFIFNPLGELGTVTSNYQEAKASMEAVDAILKLPAEPKPEHPHKLDSLDSIEFRDMSFKYATERDEDVLSHVNVMIKKGQTVAFAGPSGSGKSTLIKLIVGLYKAEPGQVLINGVDGRDVDYDTFRNRIGYVSQETQLFAGTIRENLLFVSPGATDEECIDALRAAAALPIIERGGKGLDTRIGEGGIKISGGERQRLAIARALLRKPELVIFDEATSSLDSITEHAITDTIKSISTLRPNLMLVLVAHRLSTILHADHIYALERGRVVESGTHKELLKKHGIYAALWREQSGEES